MEFGIEPHLVSGQGCGQVRDGVLIVAFLGKPHGVGELVFVEVRNDWDVGPVMGEQAAKFGEVKHVRTEDDIRFVRVFCLDLSGECNGCVTHTPFPLIAGQCHEGPLVLAV